MSDLPTTVACFQVLPFGLTFSSCCDFNPDKANRLNVDNAENPLPSEEDKKLVVVKSPNAVNPLVWDYFVSTSDSLQKFVCSNFLFLCASDLVVVNFCSQSLLLMFGR